MGRSKVLIPEDDLKRLYISEHWSPAKIGDTYGCNSITVRSRLIEAGIPLKTKSAAHTRYPKSDFNGSDIEKAYMLGFRYGDLNVYLPRGKSETIVVRSHSTLAVQGNLFKRLFESYGTITVSKNVRSTQMTTYLNMSFSFLLGKYPTEMREWLASSNERLWSFAAGYIDAEGTFGLNQGKGRFKIDAYDYEILFDIHSLFLHSGINSKFRVIARKGENDYGWIWKHDLWRISVNEAKSIETLIHKSKPYMLHEKRITDANMVLQNIAERRVHGTIAYH
ncbi:MAG: LAGLIDADG family homing endonuclease [Patescibacteria group bacterium]